MSLNVLTAISPIDGRYRNKVDRLHHYFSEFALIRYRVMIEIEYFIALTEIGLPELSDCGSNEIEALRKIILNFDEGEAERIKEIESTINHDVKAVEYYLKEKFDELKLGKHKEFIHFGLTSQDINNTALPLAVKNFINDVYAPITENLLDKLIDMAEEWKHVPLLARTHGQPASPTLLGKEIKVFIERLENQLTLLHNLPVTGKFGGATGNFNAHFAAYPDIDWIYFADDFLENSLGLERLHYTTQIDHYDNLGAIFDNLKRINTILIDLCRDFWTYISMNYFKQKINPNEVGSSAMPHKINPIDFENAEGNLGIANALFAHLSSKLPISRLQRDLTDSTVTRNTGIPCAHTVIALKSIEKGISKVTLNKEALDHDLENNWIVISEAIQTILRKEGIEAPYEKLKQLTRTNSRISKELMHEFIESLDVSDNIKSRLLSLTPFNYTGRVV